MALSRGHVLDHIHGTIGAYVAMSVEYLIKCLIAIKNRTKNKDTFYGLQKIIVELKHGGSGH